MCNAGYAGGVSGKTTGIPCAACDEGKYKDFTSFGLDSTCNECPQYSSSVMGATSRASCSCNAGFYKFTSASFTSASSTSASSDGYFRCSHCDSGKYKDSKGDGPCTSCPNNTQSLSVGSTSVSSCTPVIKPPCEKYVYSVDCPRPVSGSKSQGVCKTLIVVGLVVGIVFIS